MCQLLGITLVCAEAVMPAIARARKILENLIICTLFISGKIKAYAVICHTANIYLQNFTN